MSFLFKKMFRSIKQFKLQFVSVLLLAMLSVMIYSGLEGIWKGVETQFDSFAKETSLADEWVFASYFTDSDISKIQQMNGVEDISKRVRITASAVGRDGEDTYISLDTVGNENISSMQLMSGEEYDRALEDSVWLDRDYAGENGIGAGDSIEISFGARKVPVRVAGTVMTAERTHYVGTSDNYIPEHSRYGYGFMSDDLLQKLGIGIKCNLLEIKSSGSEVRDNINELLGERFAAYYDKDTLFDVVFVKNISGNLKRISLLFSALFILLSVLSMRTTVKRLIDAQSADITTLKSLGYSNGRLMLYYSLYGLFVTVIGTGLGYLFSFVFSKIVQKTQQALISLPQWQIKHTFGSPAVMLLIIALSVLTSVLSARKSLRGLPAESVQNKSSRSSRTMLERAGLFRRSSCFGMKWTLRDASVHKSRILLGIISVCGSFMLLIVGSGQPDSISSLIGKSYSEEFLYSYKLTLSTTNTPQQTAQLNKQLDGQLVQTVQSRVVLDNGEVYFKPITVFSDGEYLGHITTDGSRLGEDGAYITEGMADKLGVAEGDTVELFPSLSAQSFRFRIAGIVASGMPQSLYISERCWSDAGAVFRPTHLLCGETVIPKDDTRISQTADSEQQRSNLTRFKNKFTGVFTLMKAVAFVLVVIVLYNLSTLSFLERTKQYNTFRVLGFHFKEIRVLASFENILILIFGTVLGIPFGYKFLELYCATFSNDTMKIYPVLKKTGLALVCCIVFVCTAITTVLLSRKIKKIDMVQALKER